MARELVICLFVCLSFCCCCLGGWTLLRRVIIPKGGLDWKQKEIQSDKYTCISDYTNNFIAVNGNALYRLKKMISFVQLRWFCFKRARGRLFHVVTTNNTAGHRVLDYFLKWVGHTAEACKSLLDSRMIIRPFLETATSGEATKHRPQSIDGEYITIEAV